jgi:hypothetical protein
MRPAERVSQSSRRHIGTGARRSTAITALAVVVFAGAAFAAWRYFGPAAVAKVERLTTERNDAQHQLAQTRALTVEKDSLMSGLVETASLITDITQAITAVQSGHNAPIMEESGRPMTTRQARAYLLPKIDSLRMKLDATAGRMDASLARVHQMSAGEAQLRSQIAAYERTIESVRKLVASQQVQLATLGDEVTTLRAENRQLLERQGGLEAAKRSLQDSLANAEEGENTVYWIAGAKSSLLELGVVVEEGKGKFLVFGKGKTVVPGRDLKATDFNPVNKRQAVTIQLPKPNVRYRILTRQNLSALGNALDKDGHVRGALQINDPATFWAPSSYLILIEDP